jgi:quinol monooxygenase YgiN
MSRVPFGSLSSRTYPRRAIVIIVAGTLYVDPSAREAYLADCQDLIRQARDTEGCLDFYLVADPLEAGRINVFERWESVAAVEAFRGSGPSGPQQELIRSAAVSEYEIATEKRL